MESLSYIYGLRVKGTDKIRYVGLTTKTVKRRFAEHCKNARGTYKNIPVYDWMRKYGVENIECITLEECSTEQVREREIHWIVKLETFIDIGKGGLNYTGGGDLPYHSERQRQQISEAHLGKIMTPEARAKMSTSQLARWVAMTDEERAAATDHMTSEEGRKRMSELALQRIEDGTVDLSKMGSSRAKFTNHKRWHLDRAKPNLDCELCQSASPEDFVEVKVTLWNQTEEGRATCTARSSLLNHNRWHVKRNLTKEGCEHCEQASS